MKRGQPSAWLLGQLLNRSRSSRPLLLLTLSDKRHIRKRQSHSVASQYLPGHRLVQKHYRLCRNVDELGPGAVAVFARMGSVEDQQLQQSGGAVSTDRSGGLGIQRYTRTVNIDGTDIQRSRRRAFSGRTHSDSGNAMAGRNELESSLRAKHDDRSSAIVIEGKGGSC